MKMVYGREGEGEQARSKRTGEEGERGSGGRRREKYRGERVGMKGRYKMVRLWM